MQTTPSLSTLTAESGSAVYYQRSFRDMIEAHLKYIVESSGSVSETIDAQLAYKYENDLYGLLTEMKIPMAFHWIIMRVNYMTSPRDFTTEHRSLLIPTSDFIGRLKSMHTTIHKI